MMEKQPWIEIQHISHRCNKSSAAPGVRGYIPSEGGIVWGQLGSAIPFPFCPHCGVKLPRRVQITVQVLSDEKEESNHVG